jgi:hypothetical protein
MRTLRFRKAGALGAAVASLVALAAGGAALSGCGGSADASSPPPKEMPATPATLAQVYAKAQGGAVIRLAPGDYGAFHGGDRKSAPVVVRGPVHGTATLAVQLSGPQNVVVDHVRITEARLDGAADVTIARSTFTGMNVVDATRRRANILFTHNHFAAVDPCSECYEGRLTVKGDEHPDGVPVGVTIRDNRFGPGGTADGVQVIGTPYGVRIGPGNRFTGLAQSQAPDSAHTDPIQLYGSSHTVITGNWMSGNSTGIMAPDGSDHELITNNVIQTTGYPWALVMGGAQGNVISHNTLPGPQGTIEVDRANGGDPSAGVVVRDNVMQGVINARGGPATGVLQDYNLVASGHREGHDIAGRPRFAGGARPRSYAGYALAATSPGHGRASDSGSVGIAPRAAGARTR